MRIARPLTTAIAAIAAAGATPAQAANPPPAEAYGRLPAISAVALSPDGRRVVVSVGYEYRSSEPDRELTSLSVIDIDSGKIEATLAPPPKNNLRGVGWADEKRPYYFISATGRARDAWPASWPITIMGPRVEWFRTGVLSLDTGASTLLMQDSGTRGNTALTNLQAPIEGDPGYGRMVAWGGMGTLNSVPQLSVYRVNLDTGNASAVETGNFKTRGFMLDERGATIARVDIDDDKNRWRLFSYENGKDRMILEQVSEMGLPLSLYGLFEDGRIAAVNPHKEGQRDTLLAIDRKTGVATPVEGFQGTQGSDVAPIGDPWRHRVVGARWTEDLPKQHFFDAELAAIAAAVTTHFADGFVTLRSWSRDRTRVLLFGERANDAGAYYIYDTATKKLRMLGKSYPQLTSPEHLGDRQSIKYRARDGKQIPAYLTLPVGVEPRNLPLVLLVHGGPHARDDFAFDWWASFLASRGYAVLQANYRGSTGYGYEWFDAGRKGWGDGIMQTDVEDGATALVKGGYVDPRRICIMGASYGGYAALAGATLTPDRYACAVSVNGVSDLEDMLKDVRRGGRKSMVAEWWGSSMGADDMDHLRKISPLRHADAVRVPTLLLHGVEDTVVPVDQSRAMNTRLLRAKKNVRYVELQGDDHWLSSAVTRTQVLQEIEKFLAASLQPQD
jgi:dipeptidyl aminopeptidase/acylaminoacyl peptidase